MIHKTEVQNTFSLRDLLGFGEKEVRSLAKSPEELKAIFALLTARTTRLSNYEFHPDTGVFFAFEFPEAPSGAGRTLLIQEKVREPGLLLQATCLDCNEGRAVGDLCTHMRATLVLIHSAAHFADRSAFPITPTLRPTLEKVGHELMGYLHRRGNRDVFGASATENQHGSLKALVFVIPPFLKRAGASEGTAQSWPETLPAMSEIRTFDLIDERVRFEGRELDTAFDARADLRAVHWTDSPTRSQIANAIEYHFTSGLILKGPQILFHEACQSIEPDLLPILLSKQPSATFALVPKTMSGRPPSMKSRTEQTAEQILRAAHRRLKQGKLEFFVTSEEHLDQDRKAVRIDQIEFAAGPEFKWKMELQGIAEPENAVHIRMGTVEKPESIVEAMTLVVLPEQRRLVFHPWYEETNQFLKIREFVEAQGLSPVTPHQGQPTSLFQKRIRIKGHLATLVAYESLREGLGCDISPEILHSVTGKPIIDVLRDGTFRFVRELELTDHLGDTRGLMIDGFLTLGRHWALSLDQSRMEAEGMTARDIDSDRRGKRESDLKVLKHKGLFAYLFVEAWSVAQKGQLSEFSGGLPATNAKDLLTEVNDRLMQILGEELWEGKLPRLDRLVSKSVYELILTFIDNIIKVADPRGHAQARVACSRGLLQLGDTGAFDLDLLVALIQEQMRITAGACFLKSRSSPLDAFSAQFKGEHAIQEPSVVEASSDDPVFGIAPRPLRKTPVSGPTPSVAENLQTFLPLQDLGFEIRVDGKPVTNLDESDFSYRFDLRDSEESTAPDGASEVGKLDWFEMHPEFFLKGEPISMAQASKVMSDGIIEHKGTLYRIPASAMPRMKRLESFWERLTKGRPKEGGGFGREPTHWPLEKSQVLEMLALRASGAPVVGGERWQKIIAFYDSLDTKRDPLIIPKTVNAELKAYQVDGVQWLVDLKKLGLGGILADDMGLGKTLQALAFLEIDRLSGTKGPTLIVVPTSLTYNWKSEAEKFTPDLPIFAFDPKQRAPFLAQLKQKTFSVFIVSYGLLVEHGELLASVGWENLILDEAQNLKSISTRRTTVARKLTARFKLAMTGTPLENHFDELYSLLDLCVPGSFGPLTEFRRRYVWPEKMDMEDVKLLRLKIRPLVLRRTKKEILLQLPEKTESKVVIPFSEAQRKIYRDVAISWNEQVQQLINSKGEAKSQLQMLTALLRLRQVCSLPSAVPGVKSTAESPKLEALLDAITEIVDEGQSGLVFTQFLATLEHLRSRFLKLGIPCFVLQGSMPRADREKAIRGFQEYPTGAIMLMTLKTGGVGLNLTKASYVFHVEPWWNPAVENQASDRAHRLGQTKAVQVYRYIMHESVEEKIELLKARKEKRFASLFDSDLAGAESDSDLKDTGASYLSKADFEVLLDTDVPKKTTT